MSTYLHRLNWLDEATTEPPRRRPDPPYGDAPWLRPRPRSLRRSARGDLDRIDEIWDERLGTAEWMSDDEAIAKFGFDDSLFSKTEGGLWDGRSNGQVWFGETVGPPHHPLGYADDRHVTVIGGTRVGKGTSFVVPTLCLWPGSCFVIDPHGENTALTAPRRGGGSEYSIGMKQTVKILDPYNVTGLPSLWKSRFNPLDTIDASTSHAVVQAGRIAASICVAEKVDSREDLFFAGMGERFLTSVILHVVTAPEFEGRRNLISVWKLVNQGDWITARILKDHGKPNIDPFELLWEGMKRNPDFNGLVSGMGQQMISMAPKTRDGVQNTARTNLKFIDDGEMQAVVEVSDFQLNDLKSDPRGLSLYLSLPSKQAGTHFRWLRLMTDLADDEMRRIKGPPATGFPTLFLLDEFPSLKRMETIEKGAAEAAKYGIKFCFIAQRIGALKDIYKENWEAFLGAIRIFLGVDDETTQTYLSRQLGEREVRRTTQSGSFARSRGRSVSKARTDTLGRSASLSQSTSKSLGQSANLTIGESRGRSGGESNGGSGYLFPRPNWSSSTGWNAGTSRSDSSSQSASWMQGQAISDSYSLSEALSASESLSDSLTENEGWAESVHKRALLNPDEIGRHLGRIASKDDPLYPGLAVILVSGERPLLVKRVNYFESPRFRGLFDPHPNHEPPPRLADHRKRLAAMEELSKLQVPTCIEKVATDIRVQEEAKRLEEQEARRLEEKETAARCIEQLKMEERAKKRNAFFFIAAAALAVGALLALVFFGLYELSKSDNDSVVNTKVLFFASVLLLVLLSGANKDS
jgi:type IV secretory pathway TraG/TraD family ATPase VirD4